MSFPGASSSDLLNSPEISAQPSRKRQRSQSMHSDSGTSNASVKRTVADSNSANEIQIRNAGDKLFHITQSDDAYMAENLEPDIPFMPAAQPPPALSREEKLAFVENVKKVPMWAGETWYLVARDWYKRWSKALTGVVDKEGPISEQDLGPVNNSSLLDTYSNLLPSLAEGVDVEYVPKVLWDLLIGW
jgi:ubiquitin carboxyl-terminal hydrolase 4/11/15